MRFPYDLVSPPSLHRIVAGRIWPLQALPRQSPCSGTQRICTGEARSIERAFALPIRTENPDNTAGDKIRQRKSTIWKISGKRRIGSGGAYREMLPITLIFLTLLMSKFLFVIPEGPAYPALSTLVLAASTWFAGILFLPPADHPRQAGHGTLAVLIWCLKLVFVFLALAVLDPASRSILPLLPRVAATLFLLLSLSLLLTTRITARFTDSRQVVAGIAAALAALPVWLGPLVEFSGNAPLLTNTLVGASPITVFAVALDLDYLRTTWFYAHSALGSLRYDYLSWSAYATGFVIVIAGLVLAALRADNRPVFISSEKE